MSTPNDSLNKPKMFLSVATLSFHKSVFKTLPEAFRSDKALAMCP
jgi:hypothetical protein